MENNDTPITSADNSSGVAVPSIPTVFIDPATMQDTQFHVEVNVEPQILNFGGRPSIYTQELADAICAELATGKSLRSVCADEDMPAMSTIFNWFRTKEGFVEQYARAKEEACDAMVDEMLDIADDGTNDYMTITKGDYSYNVEDKEVTNRSKLRVDTRKWIVSKIKPKKYGDKLDVTSDGKAIKGNSIVFSNFNEADSKQ